MREVQSSRRLEDIQYHLYVLEKIWRAGPESSVSLRAARHLNVMRDVFAME
ncbi:MAG TPA: hypothetical protein VF275_10800 [Gammaproteobacteria bacterium]